MACDVPPPEQCPQPALGGVDFGDVGAGRRVGRGRLGLVDPAAMTALDVSTKQPPTFTIGGPPRQPDRRRDPTIV